MASDNLAYHRKYRPTTIKGYIGNERLKQTALSAINGKRPQVILLSGDSGCGKTTFARLLAKEYLCEDRDTVNGACGVCASCQELDDYIQTGDTSILANVREVDIADQSGKKDIDTVLEEMLIPAFGDQWRVFIFDEVHMATNQAQNRMLKIAEEPPENVLMIFCTTDPDMLLETLRNRCQLTLRVKKPSVSELGGLLKRVCTAEGVDCDLKGVNFIANRAGLTIRKALTSLEQVVTERGSATYESAISVFEEISDTLIVDFYHKSIGTPEYNGSGKVVKDSRGNPKMKRDVLGYVTLLHKIKSKTDLKTFVANLVEFTKRGIFVINQIQVDGVADGEIKVYRDLFGNFTVEQMAILIDKLLNLLSSSGDLETKLLSLGYTGLVTRYSSEEPNELDSGLTSALNEVTLESKNSDTERALKAKQAEEQGVLAATDLARPTELSDVQELFGNVEVIM